MCNINTHVHTEKSLKEEYRKINTKRKREKKKKPCFSDKNDCFCICFAIELSDLCLKGSFWGPEEVCSSFGCIHCSEWRYGQCSFDYKVVFGLVFGLGGSAVLFFLGLIAFFVYKFTNRPNRYVIVS